jgi:hypothetical protein
MGLVTTTFLTHDMRRDLRETLAKAHQQIVAREAARVARKWYRRRFRVVSRDLRDFLLRGAVVNVRT